MVKILASIMLFVFISISPNFSQAQDLPASTGSNESEIFAGAGEALSFPSSVRFRSGAIEGGYLSPGLLGIAKLYRNPSYPSTYTEFGFGLTFFDGAKPAAFGAMGYRFTIWKALKFRTELNMTGSVDSHVKGGALVGISLVF